MSSPLLDRLARLDRDRLAVVERLTVAAAELGETVTAIHDRHHVQIAQAEATLAGIEGEILATIEAYRDAAHLASNPAPQAPISRRLDQIPPEIAAEILEYLHRVGPARARDIREGIRTRVDTSFGLWTGYLAILARDGILNRTGPRAAPIYAPPPRPTDRAPQQKKAAGRKGGNATARKND